MYICTSCGAQTELKEHRCPNCSGMLQPLPEGFFYWPQSELNGKTHVKSIEGRLVAEVKNASKNIGVGKDHLRRGHYKSAANSFRTAMEHMLDAWMMAGSLDGYVFSGWICAENALTCKALDEVTAKPADQIAYLRSIGAITEDERVKFESVRSWGNRGSHAGGVVSKKEAREAKSMAASLLERLNEVIAAAAEEEPSDEWKLLAQSKRTASARYVERLKEDIAFLQEKNQKSQDFVARQEKHLDWAVEHSSWSDVRDTRARINEAKAEIEKREGEIGAKWATVLQICFDGERLTSVCAPASYQKLQAEREQRRIAAISEDRLSQKIAQSNKRAMIAFALVFIALILIIWVLPILGVAMEELERDGAQAQAGSRPSSSIPAILEDASASQRSQDDAESSGGSKAQVRDEAENDSDDYILADSDSRYYTKAELRLLGAEGLYYARNEIYARHGRGFVNADLQTYFNQKSWYAFRYSPESFDAMPSPLNDYEKKNAELMLDIEKAQGSPYLAH